MNETALRNELYAFYLKGDVERSKAFAEKCFSIMDSRFREDMSVTAQKLLQYDVICEEFEPVIFRHNPFFYETGVLTSLSDGSRTAKNHGFIQANGWVFMRNCHLFQEQDPVLFQKRSAQLEENLYLICGFYNDASQHFNFNFRPILEVGLKGIYEKAQAELPKAKNSSEAEFLSSVCHGMVTMGRMAEKFGQKALQMSQVELDDCCRENLLLIARTAKRVPWEAPKTFYEALATLAFLRTVSGSLEGVGPNTFGRVDKDLISFYNADLAAGRLTYEQAYDLVCQFLLIWDCHYDHNMPMVGYADHELENSYILGGCDDSGNPLYNPLTKMFLDAAAEKKIIFPKIKCRFSKNSPKEYLDTINAPILKGSSMVLLQNDDATIPALVRAGRPLKEARDYSVTGCWGVATAQEKYDHGSYLNMLKALEIPLHDLKNVEQKVQIVFDRFDNCQSFEEMYQILLKNCQKLLHAKLDVTRSGGQIHHKVDRLPIFSATLENCLEKRADFTEKGGKYRDDYQQIFGLPNLVDSLLAIKQLVFDSRAYTLEQYLQAVRANWEGFEDIRAAAMKCPGWGDGSKESTFLANRFNNDLFTICEKAVGTYGGKVHLGHLTYTEIRWWGEKTLATPDGRKSGDYFAQGLTPSRLKKIPCVNDVINSMASLDASTMAGNSVVNLIIPSGVPLDRCEGLLRAISTTAVQSLQLNCTTKEELLDAQKHPERYPDLIVRVTGFSAKFTSLSKDWQTEVITRNFYEG